MGKLYCFLEETNILNYIAIKYLKADDVVIIRDEGYEPFYGYSRFKNFLESKNICKVSTEIVDLYSIADIEKLTNRIGKDDRVVIPTSPYAYSINLYEMIKAKNSQLYLVEEDGDIFKYDGKVFNEIKFDDVELNVSDYIDSFGGHIYESNKALFNEKAADEILNLILDNLHTYRTLTRSDIPFKTDLYNQDKFHIYYNKVEGAEKTLLERIVDLMHKKHLISIKGKYPHKVLFFKDRRYKDYIAKTGTWLEHVTYRALKEIDGLSDVNASVAFEWDSKKSSTRNEIDLLGVYDNKLIVISCKDTKNHYEDQLNTLIVHSENLGDSDALKIFSAGKKPKPSIWERAKELGIFIALWQDDYDKYKSDLEKFIKSGKY